jgi:hypothetical protein
LELIDVDIELTFETKRRGKARNNLSNNAIEVLVSRSLNAEILLANVIDSLVVKHEGAVSMLKKCVGRKDGVVGLNNGCRNLRGRIDAEVELGLLAIVRRETLKKERAKARSSTSADGVEDEEALETVALISDLANAIQGGVEEILANSVVATGVVVGRVLLATDELIGMEELRVSAVAHFVDNRGLKVNHDGTRHILAAASLAEEGLEALVVTSVGHGAIGLNAMFKAIEFPAGITSLDARLANVERDDFAHDGSV